ncbi:hypothetical protein, partial [Cohnella sp. REN36]|uniref:hypothetical protein n=1 Tax=Cohnella sp. REN36 TaxID=2887347 RepID=UPI001D150C5B
NDRRAILLQEVTLDVFALDKVDQALLRIEELILERNSIISEKQQAVRNLYQQWQQLFRS